MYKLADGRALVQTVDFFTPIVDDPHTYGRIAAANALSDVYAMGGRPLTALAIAGFPKDADRDILKQIFAGGLATLREAGVALLGGHTVQDVEIKFGYAVTGEVDPSRILSNAGARPFDELLLTKPIGSGVIATALKFDRAPAEAVSAAVAVMTGLNRAAAEIMAALPPGAVSACTDITGFGLLGHATELAVASGCTLEIEAGAVPLIRGALPLAAGNIPGGGRSNRQHFGPQTRVAEGVDSARLVLLFDPQTSGGLLVAAHPDHAAALLASFREAGIDAARIGRAAPRADTSIVILP